MISLLRIDDRLLHGQVAVAWTPFLGAAAIIVANDKVATDNFQKMALNLAKPTNVKLLVKTISETAEILNDARYKPVKMLVLVNSVNDAFTLSELVPEVKSVNLGGIRSREGSKPVSKAVSLTPADFNYLKKMEQKGMELEIRQVSTDKKQILKMEDI